LGRASWAVVVVAGGDLWTAALKQGMMPAGADHAALWLDRRRSVTGLSWLAGARFAVAWRTKTHGREA
jgi:hypothetical protein